MAVTIANPDNGKEEEVYALIDTGSDRDFMSKELAERLGLKINVKWTELHTVNTSTKGWSPQSSIGIRSRDGSYMANVKDALVGDFAAANGEVGPAKRDLSKYSHIVGTDFIDIDSKVEALICAAHGETWHG